MKKNILLIHPKDNVAVAIGEIKAGELLMGIEHKELKALTDIPPSHKVALEDIPAQGKIIKYGESVGLALKPIQAGEWVHTHNMKGEGE